METSSKPKDAADFLNAFARALAALLIWGATACVFALERS